MTYDLIKAELSAPDFGPEGMFAALRGAARLANNPATLAQGRDLVIRLLSKASLCGQFERRILISLVRTVGLFPYMKEYLALAEDDDLLAYQFHYMKELDVVFHGLQARIYDLLLSGSNVVLSASTSAGKSLLIDAMIASEKFRKVVIILPTLALIDETRRRLSARFGERRQIVTQPSQQAAAGSKSVYILTQERARKRDDLDDVDFFVIDEFYKLDIRKVDDGDTRRAIELNLCFHKLAAKGAQFYLLGPNIHAIRGLERHEVHFIPSGFATVAVDIVHHDMSSSKPERLEKLIEILRDKTGPTLIYCQSANSAAAIAEHLIGNEVIDPPASTAPIADWLSENFHPEWIVAKAVRAGIGVHHGSLPRSVQQLMVRLFNEGAIRLLVCTSTLIEGVNTAAETVIIFDRRKRRPFDFFTYKNIQGRAGRMGRYFVGKVHVLEKPPAEEPFVVEYEIGRQDDETPMELILQLPGEDLTQDSAERIKEELDRSLLAEDTIRANASVSVEIQNDIAREIAHQLNQGSELFNWTGLRCSHLQLAAACELIVSHIRAPRGLADHRVFSGSQLALRLRQLEYDGFKSFLDKFVEEEYPGSTIGSRVDVVLNFVRRVVCYQFSQDLMVIDRIQRDVALRLGYEPGSYGLYAEHAENLFMPGSLTALEEYGLPLQIVRKIGNSLAPYEDFDGVLARLKKLDVNELDLTQFEREWLADTQAGI
ncbi:hypothetical protein J2X48_001372 [Bosea sp. BE271]|uniref:helicase-related protein n=1 Tax=Bosea TaxID=85413 RepID=UPI002861448D|nr:MULTISPECIES: helicase-related protein [Bosea]MDR6827646.1 hypothetical protein [Bosea robiniae]MDR6894660.1 hypothetical protein [Bosea sp. BE109]MDR7137752.1 hypothetical protein [Bosea sp. BE168]MDR7174451.1 hypothetical protein [Bosea sp. BE271]